MNYLLYSQLLLAFTCENMANTKNKTLINENMPICRKQVLWLQIRDRPCGKTQILHCHCYGNLVHCLALLTIMERHRLEYLFPDQANYLK